MEIPSSLEKTDGRVFSGCENIRFVKLYIPSPSESYESGVIFDSPGKITLYVLKDYVDDFRRHPYYRQFRRIEGMDLY